ncbi:hypothetical protein ACWGI8_27070 [Streptomyces sp. NPDC054841]
MTTPVRSEQEAHRLLDRADELRDERRYEEAFHCAQAALEALPADGSMDRDEREKLQLTAWLKREHALGRLTEMRSTGG